MGMAHIIHELHAISTLLGSKSPLSTNFHIENKQRVRIGKLFFFLNFEPDMRKFQLITPGQVSV